MPAAPPDNRRVAPRLQPAFLTVYHLEPGPNGAGLALVWNISASGIGMLVPEPRDAGAILRGRLATEDGRHSLPIDLEIVHVRKVQTGDYFIGGRFARPLSKSDLAPFLTPPAPDAGR